MAYTALTSAEIAAGEPTKQELFQKLKDNFDNHETRITSVEAAVANLTPLQFYVAGGYWGAGAPQTQVLTERLSFDISILAVRLVIIEAGISGTTTIDLEYKRGAGSWTSIFSTKPAVAYTDGDMAVSTNQILSVTDLQAGDFLRLNIDTVQDRGMGLVVYVEYET